VVDIQESQPPSQAVQEVEEGKRRNGKRDVPESMGDGGQPGARKQESRRLVDLCANSKVFANIHLTLHSRFEV
jgi:hypothetical protein